MRGENFYENLKDVGDILIELWIMGNVKRNDIQNQTAIIHGIKGDQGEE